MNTPHYSRRNFLKMACAAAGVAALPLWPSKLLADSKKSGNAQKAVIIGSGLGGLVSGAYLAKAGWNVAVLESHSIPGGYATSFDRGDFTFDVSLHSTVAEHGIPQRILKELDLWDKVDVVYCPELKRIVTPEFDITLPARNPDGVKQAIAMKFPHERKGIFAFLGQMEQVVAELWGQKKYAASMLRLLEPLTLSQWMDLHVSDPGARYCLSAFCGYYGSTPEKINALFYAIATGEYMVKGGQYYKTRGQSLSNVLADSIERNGGSLIFDTSAEKINFSSAGKIESVLDDNGTIHKADNVIVNANLRALTGGLLPDTMVPGRLKKTAAAKIIGPSTFVIWLGLNKRINHIHDYEIRIVHDFKGAASGFNGMGLNLYDNLFEGYSAPGKSTVSIIGVTPWSDWQRFSADYYAGKKDAYNSTKQAIADQMIQKAQKDFIPNLSNMIEEMEIATPLTNEYFTGNPGGSIHGFEGRTDLLKSNTGIPGLYLASAWSHGGGYTPAMMAGRDAARLCFAKNHN